MTHFVSRISVLLALLCAPSLVSAQAPDMTFPAPAAPDTEAPSSGGWARNAGKFGTGGTVTLGGTGPALGLRYQLSDDVGLEAALLFGMSSRTQEPMGGGDGVETSTTTLGLGAYGLFSLETWEDARYGLIAGLDLVHAASTTETAGNSSDSSTTAFGFAGGLFAEIFLADFFSVYGRAGIALSVGSSDPDRSTFSFGTSGSMFGGFGFTAWWL